MTSFDPSMIQRIQRDAELLARIAIRREREGDPGIFSSVEREILKRVCARELTPDKAAELDRINAEIAASEQALRDGSIQAAEAALWHADWVAEKILFEAELQVCAADRMARSLGRIERMEPHTDSGIYRGLVVGETARHVVQQLTGMGLVAHRKESLDCSPRAGERVTVRYSNGQGIVREAAFRSRGREKGRQ